MMPAQAAARRAREKKTLIRKVSEIVDRMKHMKKANVRVAEECASTSAKGAKVPKETHEN